ncbi:hypothetical protein V8G54_020678 [Vigna mungo]|uniref:Uncharacterized protein n=1 Tax=Vigna mungo TaxID=3915 RepID=A0AAQ3NCW7_VIGMU
MGETGIIVRLDRLEGSLDPRAEEFRPSMNNPIIQCQWYPIPLPLPLPLPLPFPHPLPPPPPPHLSTSSTLRLRRHPLHAPPLPSGRPRLPRPTLRPPHLRTLRAPLLLLHPRRPQPRHPRGLQLRPSPLHRPPPSTLPPFRSHKGIERYAMEKEPKIRGVLRHQRRCQGLETHERQANPRETHHHRVQQTRWSHSQILPPLSFLQNYSSRFQCPTTTLPSFPASSFCCSSLAYLSPSILSQ